MGALYEVPLHDFGVRFLPDPFLVAKGAGPRLAYKREEALTQEREKEREKALT